MVNAKKEQSRGVVNAHKKHRSTMTTKERVVPTTKFSEWVSGILIHLLLYVRAGILVFTYERIGYLCARVCVCTSAFVYVLEWLYIYQIV